MTDGLELTLFEILMITPKDVDISLVLFYHTINSGERGPLSHKWYHVYTFFFSFLHILHKCVPYIVIIVSFLTLFAPHLFTAPSVCLSQCWSVPVGGLQVEPEQLRIPAGRTGPGTVTTGGQHSLTLNLSLSFASLLFYVFCYFFSFPLALILLSHNHLFHFLLLCLS